MASIADLPGTAPNWEGLRAPHCKEALAILLAAIASRDFEMLGRSDIGRYDLARWGGLEPFLGIMTHLEIFHSSGWCPNRRQAVKRLVRSLGLALCMAWMAWYGVPSTPGAEDWLAFLRDMVISSGVTSQYSC